ncbi:MAG: RDD family protein [Candidatus Dormiibacterota bacterium]
MGNWQTTPPPPTMSGPGFTAAGSGQLAGFGARLVAWIIDWVILIVINIILSIVFSLVLHGSGTYVGSLLALLINLAYFGYFWGSSGQSLGYRAMHIKLVGTGGAPVGYGIAIVRALLVWLSFAICIIPAIVSLIMIAAGSRKAAIHDLILGTSVVAE